MLDETTKDLLIAEINKFLPKDSQSKLISAMRYVLLAPAKHIRPFLVIASSQVFNVEAEKVISIAVAVECVHTYSLIHDDLPCMDNSDTRRGQLSCHKKFDEAMAVLAGDALLTLAFEVLSLLDEDSNKRCEIIKVLSQAIGARGMVGGQVLDINSEQGSKSQPSVMQVADTKIQHALPANILYQEPCNGGEFEMDSSVSYSNPTLRSQRSYSCMCDARITPDNKIKEIHLMKTAKLFAASCKIGAIMGGAADEQRKALYDYGTNLGLIFQAKDDVKDYGHDKISNLMYMLGKSEVENYVDSLFKQASDNLSKLPGDTSCLYDLLNQVRKDG
ncbi:polyprenyl synthetase family protein [Candidatus Wolbachia massiliensis]|uniref:Polyprenyl synthetase family protein n=1 Tax=Candidatus Wolbachia massiliensis TaxID=1845000 RepID=A0A7L7YQD9_9RICK|nr:polyprenyl synthetase family protein [Candidatus Wolbachia massiliensis]QOD38249.1 polyprenyl synthetase family protein [Candidatus Wolbachia massiliensis]